MSLAHPTISRTVTMDNKATWDRHRHFKKASSKAFRETEMNLVGFNGDYAPTGGPLRGRVAA